MSVSAPTKHLIEDMDPSQLVATRNVRPVELDEEFVGSIREHGLLQPIVATPFEDGYAIVFGNRRTAGAIAAERTVDVIVRDDLDGDAMRIVAQLVENMHRQDMKTSEIAAAYAQLALDLGMSDEEIAKRVSKDRKEVRAAIALHDMPKAARDAADSGTLDLEIAGELQAFESDPKVYKRLLGVIEKGSNLRYALTDERKKKEKREKKAAIVAELKAAGVTVIGKPRDLGWAAKEARLSDLHDAEGGEITASAHSSCPGHAAYMEDNYYGAAPEPKYVCRDPKAHGHATPSNYRHRTAEEVAAEEEDKRRDAEAREALAVAAEVRAQFITELCRSKKVPKGVMRYALEALFAHGVSDTRTRETLVLTYLGARDVGEEPEAVFSRKLARIAEARQPLVLLAHVAGRAEENMQAHQNGWSYRSDDALAISWLDFLAGQGYQLTDPESVLLDALREREAARAARDAEREPEDTEDDDQEDEEDEEDEDESESGDDDGADEPDDESSWEQEYPQLDEPVTVAA